MSARLENAAETLKLGRLLGLGPEDLTFLDSVPASEIRALRERVTDSLFDAVGTTLDGLAAASRLLPAPLVATIAERYFGPLLCARAAAAVDPARAIDLAGRLSVTFLADATVELDPRRVAEIIAGVPATMAAPVARVLGERGEYVTMGRFLAFVPDDAIVSCMGALSDEAMLRTAFVLEHKDRLDHAVALLPTGRLPGVLRTAAELRLWPEVLDLLDQLSQERLGAIADMVVNGELEVIVGLVTSVSELGLWDSLLPVVSQMSESARVTVVGIPTFHEPRILGEIIHAAAHQGLWRDLIPLLDALPPDVRVTVAEQAAALSPELLERVLNDAASAPETFETLCRLVGDLPTPGLVAVCALLERADRSLADGLLASIGYTEDAARLYAMLPQVIRDAIRDGAARLGLSRELDEILA